MTVVIQNSTAVSGLIYFGFLLSKDKELRMKGKKRKCACALSEQRVFKYKFAAENEMFWEVSHAFQKNITQFLWTAFSLLPLIYKGDSIFSFFAVVDNYCVVGVCC